MDTSNCNYPEWYMENISQLAFYIQLRERLRLAGDGRFNALDEWMLDKHSTDDFYNYLPHVFGKETMSAYIQFFDKLEEYLAGSPENVSFWHADTCEIDWSEYACFVYRAAAADVAGKLAEFLSGNTGTYQCPDVVRNDPFYQKLPKSSSSSSSWGWYAAGAVGLGLLGWLVLKGTKR